MSKLFYLQSSSMVKFAVNTHIFLYSSLFLPLLFVAKFLAVIFIPTFCRPKKRSNYFIHRCLQYAVYCVTRVHKTLCYYVKKCYLCIAIHNIILCSCILRKHICCAMRFVYLPFHGIADTVVRGAVFRVDNNWRTKKQKWLCDIIPKSTTPSFNGEKTILKSSCP